MKRGKLLLSLSLISLAIAILCFGVLSAVTVNYGISGNITYSIKDVFVKINTRVYKIAEQQDKATVIANVKELETTPLASISTSEYTLSQTMVEYDSTNADTETVTHTAKDSSGNTIQIAYGDYYTYYIVINIKNLTSAKSNVCAYLTDNTTGDTNSVKTTNLYQNNIASTDTKNIVIAYSIKDKTSEVTSVAIDYSLKVSYETTPYTSGVSITTETVNSIQGYYITLGKTSTSVTNNDVKWRLVSLDGMSKYTYSTNDEFDENDNARYLSDAVFLQETVVGEDVNFDMSGSANYFNSQIRTKVKNGQYLNITSADLSFVRARRISKITVWDGYYEDETERNSMRSYCRAGTTEIVNDESDEGDKFWLLSCEEIFDFFEISETSRSWGNKDYWLRTKADYGVCVVTGEWVDCRSTNDETLPFAIRSAFQLL